MQQPAYGNYGQPAIMQQVMAQPIAQQVMAQPTMQTGMPQPATVTNVLNEFSHNMARMSALQSFGVTNKQYDGSTDFRPWLRTFEGIGARTGIMEGEAVTLMGVY